MGCQEAKDEETNSKIIRDRQDSGMPDVATEACKEVELQDQAQTFKSGKCS